MGIQWGHISLSCVVHTWGNTPLLHTGTNTFSHLIEYLTPGGGRRCSGQRGKKHACFLLMAQQPRILDPSSLVGILAKTNVRHLHDGCLSTTLNPP